MVDLVERLREVSYVSAGYRNPDGHEAAAEIERLRAQLAEALARNEAWQQKLISERGNRPTEQQTAGLSVQEIARQMEGRYLGGAMTDGQYATNDSAERAAQAAETLAAQLAEARNAALEDCAVLMESYAYHHGAERIRALKGSRT